MRCLLLGGRLAEADPCRRGRLPLAGQTAYDLDGDDLRMLGAGRQHLSYAGAIALTSELAALCIGEAQQADDEKEAAADRQDQHRPQQEGCNVEHGMPPIIAPIEGYPRPRKGRVKRSFLA